MTYPGFALVLFVLIASGLLVVGRRLHVRRVAAVRRSILVEGDGARFARSEVAGLPEVARVFFEHAIEDGAPLARSVTLKMEGAIGLHRGAARKRFVAEQALSRRGLVWAARVGEGVAAIVGDDSYADGRGAMAWFLADLVPVVRATGDHVSRSAAGRVALEVLTFLPPALLPDEGVRWEEIDRRTARLTMRVDDEILRPFLTIADDGRLLRVEMLRWDADCGDGSPGHVVWVAEMHDERTFDGYTIPTALRVTKRWGTPEADAFFEAVITSAEFR